jgi:aminoglycoside phosphotransferase (APT) family kinase protein
MTEQSMTAGTQPFNLDLLGDGEHITRLIQAHFKATVTAVSKVGQGFYAHIYRVSLDKDPKDVILKCHKYAGRSEKEQRQLEVLQRHAVVKVPQVYGLHLQSELVPCEALSMEFIPGVDASQITFPDEASKTRFVDLVVENLLAWHAVQHPQGFGELEGPFYTTWTQFFRRKVADYYARVHREGAKEVVSEYVMGVIDRSFENLDRILQGANGRPALVHSDYNAWNMMVDPQTCELTGIIDPIDAGWSDSEIDLFHLPNCRPDLGLLERYLQEVEVDAGFWMRFKFYRFWDDVKHYVRMGWYEEGRFRGYAEELEAAMAECLG